MDRSRTRPPAQTLAWVERTIGRRARVVRCRRLTGGIASLVHQVTVEQDGRRRSYVLRHGMADYDDHGVRAVGSETAILTALEASDIPAPRVVGSTTEAPDGGPAVLMTRLEGRVHLMARDREDWLRQMARMLARIHGLEIPAAPFESWIDPTRLSPPPDVSRPEIWRDAIALVSTQPAPIDTCFLHRDYQHFNLLWSRERLTGVVDWANACIGPPAVDVGHCRLNLSLLFSADIAERFRHIYEAEAGRAVDPRWDVHALLSFGPDWKTFLPIQIDGRAPLDVAGMTSRVEDLLERTLRRL